MHEMSSSVGDKGQRSRHLSRFFVTLTVASHLHW